MIPVARPPFYRRPATVMDDSRVGAAANVDGQFFVSTGVDSTFDLLARAKAGDREATDRLFARFLPQLRRWASGRLPRWTRDLMDTDDLVQETIIRALHRIDAFESRHEGALQAYLRQAILNRIKDEVRRTVRSPAAIELDENQKDPGDSPDLWTSTMQVALFSYDALPLIGKAAAAAYPKASDEGPGPWNAEIFFHIKGQCMGREMSVMEMKARQLALAVIRTESTWLRAWNEAQKAH